MLGNSFIQGLYPQVEAPLKEKTHIYEGRMRFSKKLSDTDKPFRK